MTERSPNEIDEKEVDKLIKNFDKKPSREVRERLSSVLSNQREQFLAKEQNRGTQERTKNKEIGR